MIGVQSHRSDRVEAVVIGASAGSLSPLREILAALSAEIPFALLAVVHRGRTYDSDLCASLRVTGGPVVKEAEHAEPIAPGTLYLAPADYHLLVERNRTLSVTLDDPVRFSRPSIDVLFETAALAYGPHLAGVVLSGANDDGARGLAAVAERGGLAIVQEPRTAAAEAMPRAARATVPSSIVLPPGEIGRAILANAFTSVCAGEHSK